MRKLIPALALSCVSLAFCGTVSTVSAAGLDPAECRPLTAENASSCCAAANWNHLVLTNDQELCRSLRRGQPLAAALAVGTPQSPNPPLGTNPPSGTLDQGQNNGFGNGDQTAPGDSQPNNNAENANNGDGRANPSNSGSSIN